MNVKKVSLADIASSLGISKSTVSFVLNNKGDQYNISAETQKAIKEKAKELNYTPNFFAKGLREGKTKTIGLIIPDINHSIYAALSKFIQQTLFDIGYHAFIVNTNDKKQLELDLIDELINRSIDGLIIARCNEVVDLQPILDNTPIPVVFMDRIADEHGDFVGINYFEEAYESIQLFKQKPKSLVIAHTQELNDSISASIKGIVMACNEQGIEYGIYNKVECDKLEKDRLAFDTILALDCQAAMTAWKCILESGKKTQLISLEEHNLFQFISPSISAKKQPIEKIGQEAVKQLMKRLEAEQKRGTHLFLKSEFIARESH